MRTPVKQQQVPRQVTRLRRVLRVARVVERISRVVLVWMLGLSVLYATGYVLYFGQVFGVERVVIHGDLKMATEAGLREWAKIPQGTNMFRLSMDDVQQRLLSHPWMRSVAVRRKLPHTIWIYVVEREPMAIVHTDGLFLVDTQGEIFKPVAAGDPMDLPVFSGITDIAVDAHGVGHSSQLEQLIEVYRTFESHAIATQLGISEILQDRFGRVSLVTEQPALYLRLGAKPQPEQFDRLLTVLPMVEREHRGAIGIDLYGDRKVVVRPAPSVAKM